MICFGMILQAQTTFDMQITEISNDGVNYVVKIEMQMNGDNVQDLKLGSSSFQFKFPNEALSSPVLQSTTLPSSFPYFEPTVTTPRINECSFNVELSTPGTGVAIAQAPAWTTLGEISFTIENPSLITPMIWSYNGGTTETVVFIDDEETQIFREEGAVSITEMLDNNTSFSVFPNPSSGESLMINLDLSSGETAIIEVVDNLGKIVYSKDYSKNNQSEKIEINFSNKLVSGIYSINVKNEKDIISSKFIVE